MLKYWKKLGYTTKFSIVAFVISGILGLFSMGLLGAALYFPVSFLFSSYPSFNEWHGDWVWPATIMVGILWSLGFVFAGTSWHYLRKLISSLIGLQIIYVLILWFWAAILWYFILISNAEYLQ